MLTGGVSVAAGAGAGGAASAEDPYADLNEVGPIQNQKRRSGGKKSSSCKQQ